MWKDLNARGYIFLESLLSLSLISFLLIYIFPSLYQQNQILNQAKESVEQSRVAMELAKARKPLPETDFFVHKTQDSIEVSSSDQALYIELQDRRVEDESANQ